MSILNYVNDKKGKKANYMNHVKTKIVNQR